MGDRDWCLGTPSMHGGSAWDVEYAWGGGYEAHPWGPGVLESWDGHQAGYKEYRQGIVPVRPRPSLWSLYSMYAGMLAMLAMLAMLSMDEASQRWSYAAMRIHRRLMDG